MAPPNCCVVDSPKSDTRVPVDSNVCTSVCHSSVTVFTHTCTRIINTHDVHTHTHTHREREREREHLHTSMRLFTSLPVGINFQPSAFFLISAFCDKKELIHRAYPPTLVMITISTG